MELETGKDFKTYFMDTQVNCLCASKIFWKEIDIYRMDSGSYRGYETFISDEETRLSAYKDFLKHTKTTSIKIAEGMESIISEDKDFTTEQIEAIKNSTQKITVNCEFVKKAICCPACHKVHNIEDFIIVKDAKKKIIEKVKEEYGDHWYSLFACDKHLNPNDYFETIYEGFEAYSLDEYFKENPEARQLHDAFPYAYYNDNCDYCRFYPKLVCPDCGCFVNTYRFKTLSIFNKYDSENSVLNAITIFNDNKKIAVSALFRTYYLNVDALTIARDEYRIRLTFNTETGQTYFIGPKKLNGKKMPGWHSGYLINLTFRMHYYNPYPMETLLNSALVKKEVLALLMEKNGDTIEKFKSFPIWSPYNDPYFEEEGAYEPEEIKELSDIDFSLVPLSWITLYNKFPCLNGEQIMNLYPKSYMESYPDNYFMKHLFKGVKRDSSAKELLEQVVKNSKAPSSKKIRKIIASDLIKAKNIMLFKKCGFKDINIIQRFLELPTEQQENFHRAIYKQDLPNVKIFIVDMIAKKGESKTFATLFNNNSRCYNIVDSARMYVKFKAADMVSKEYFTDDIKKIHDRMSRDFPKIKFKNQAIEYPKKSEKYNMVISNEYEFNLAEDTNELVRIGQELKICVGGYRDSALEGRCRIISIKQSGKYVGCIELSSDFNKLIQAKAVCNNRLQEHKAQALKEWVETLGINADNCYDYEHIKAGEISFDSANIYSSGYDYHHYELDDDGNVVTADRNRNARQNNQNADWDDAEYLPFN